MTSADRGGRFGRVRQIVMCELYTAICLSFFSFYIAYYLFIMQSVHVMI